MGESLYQTWLIQSGIIYSPHNFLSAASYKKLEMLLKWILYKLTVSNIKLNIVVGGLGGQNA